MREVILWDGSFLSLIPGFRRNLLDLERMTAALVTPSASCDNINYLFLIYDMKRLLNDIIRGLAFDRYIGLNTFICI